MNRKQLSYLRAAIELANKKASRIDLLKERLRAFDSLKDQDVARLHFAMHKYGEFNLAMTKSESDVFLPMIETMLQDFLEKEEQELAEMKLDVNTYYDLINEPVKPTQEQQ